MVQSGIQRALGANLRRFMGAALGNRIRAVLAGLGITALLQSSTATALMVTSFAANGIVELMPALAALLGANVGSTLTVQVLSFNIARLAPVFVLIGVVAFRRGQPRTRDLGRVAIGVGLMIMALARVLEITTPFEDAPSLRLMMGSLATDSLVAAIVGAILTWLAHSSVAVVLLIMSLAAGNVIPPDAAFALVIGANIGTALNPVLEGTFGADPAARRLPVGNLLLRIVGGVLTLTCLGPLGRVMVVIEPDAARATADFHTGFNVVLALLALPVLGPYAKLLCRLFPQRIDALDPSRPLYLDEASIEVPSLAITQAAREALRMSDVVADMLAGVSDALIRSERRRIDEIRQLDDILDRLNTAIGAYLAALDSDSLEQADHRRMLEVLAFATNMEHAGDTIERNVLAHASKQLRRGLTLTAEEQAGIKAMVDRLTANVRAAAAVFMAQDARAARSLAAEKRAFRHLETKAAEGHFRRMQQGRVGHARTSTMYVDLVRDLKQVNGHLVAASAYPILETGGELRSSRLRQDD